MRTNEARCRTAVRAYDEALDVACAMVQASAGATSGDRASIAFSGDLGDRIARRLVADGWDGMVDDEAFSVPADVEPAKIPDRMFAFLERKFGVPVETTLKAEFNGAFAAYARSEGPDGENDACPSPR